MNSSSKSASQEIIEAIEITIDFFADYPEHDEELVEKFLHLMQSFPRDIEQKGLLQNSLAEHWGLDIKRLSRYSDEQLLRLALNSVSNKDVKNNLITYLNYGSTKQV